jgi:gliding motility-associated lipoprotein GldJ
LRYKKNTIFERYKNLSNMTVKQVVLSVFLLGTALMYSCSNKNTSVSGDASTTTGWSYNDAENGGFQVVKYKEQETGPGLVFIEGGTFTMGQVEQDVMFDWNNTPRRVTVSSFYMDETEVRNVDYREYLYWLTKVFASMPQVYRNALPDTLVWRDPMAYNEPYVEYYFRHPAYNEYPVVGVDWLQANDYCSWRTDRVNEALLVNEGVLNWNPQQVNEDNFNTDAYLAGQYEGSVNEKKTDLMGNARNVSVEDGILLPKYRLPTEAEWEYAAYGYIGNSEDERVYERKIYPWNGHSLRNASKEDRGQMHANYMRGRGDNMGTAGALNDNADVTAPVKKYWPNDYGLYNMAGNVSEWVMDVYRPLSSEDMNEFRPFRGNVFQKPVKDADGNFVQKDSLGRLRMEQFKEEEVAQRRNFTKSDYRNYKDGDYSSSIEYKNEDAYKGSGSDRMYSQKEGDYSSLVSDQVHVVKGGSWKDRAYYLGPGTRRFLHEKDATDDIGFRCAMTRVGSPTGLE